MILATLLAPAVAPSTDGLEQIEIDAWLTTTAPPHRRPLPRPSGLETAELGGPLLAMCKRIDHYQFNRLMGGGLSGDAEGGSLAIAAERFRDAGLKNGYLQIAPGGRAWALEAKARALDLKPLEACMGKILARRRAGAGAAQPACEIAEAKPAEAMDFARAVTAGFGMPETLAPWLAAIVGRKGWHAYVARDNGKAVGGCGDVCGRRPCLAGHRRRAGCRAPPGRAGCFAGPAHCRRTRGGCALVRDRDRQALARRTASQLLEHPARGLLDRLRARQLDAIESAGSSVKSSCARPTPRSAKRPTESSLRVLVRRHAATNPPRDNGRSTERHMDAIRLTSFTAGPTTVKSRRSSLPMLP